MVALQTERAFTPPLLANMGTGGEPDIRNITSPRLTSFNNLSWAAVTEEVSAHSVGGLRFSSFRLAHTLQLAAYAKLARMLVSWLLACALSGREPECAYAGGIC